MIINESDTDKVCLLKRSLWIKAIWSTMVQKIGHKIKTTEFFNSLNSDKGFIFQNFQLKEFSLDMYK